MLNIKDLLKAMDDMWEESEIEFDWTKSFYNLQKTCSVHHVGMKNLELQRYTCPRCNRILEKICKFTE